MLNAQLVVRRYNKAVRQLQNNFILTSQSQRLLTYDLTRLIASGVFCQHHVVVGYTALSCDNAIHWGQFNSQLRKGAVFLRCILYFNINVGLVNNLDFIAGNSRINFLQLLK